MPRAKSLLLGDLVKTYHRGTHRTVSPETTLARIEPLMRDMGITRIANVTGLDDIGVPVVMVCRPNARSISVSQGKGIDLAAAKASGLMEAIETYHAEHITQPLKLTSHRELSQTEELIDIEQLPRSVTSRYHQDLPLLWIEGRNLINDRPLWLPYELVHTNYTLPQPTGSGCFPANTNGLASGNHILEAIAHGIYEVVERDALTLWRLGPPSTTKRKLDLDTVRDPASVELLQKLEHAGLDVTVWDATSDVGIACFYCLLMGRDDEVEPEFGAGCHPARNIALLRALTEAVQARTTYIAGSRDDFSPAIYAASARALRIQACRNLLAQKTSLHALQSLPNTMSDVLNEDIDWSLERLQSAGVDQVVIVDLTQEKFQIPVVRTVIPGLEGVYKGGESDYVPGARARAIMERIS